MNDLWHTGLNQWILYTTDNSLIQRLTKDKRFTQCGSYMTMTTKGRKARRIGVQFKFHGGTPLRKKDSLLGEVMNDLDMKWKFLKYIKPRIITNNDPECTLTYREAERLYGV